MKKTLISEDKMPLRKEQVELIEELAHVHETLGIPPAMGKILALLTVNDAVELTFDQIKDTLDLSKSAVSQSLNQLQLLKKIGYKTRIGDRKRYFHIKVADWETQIMDQFSGVAALVNINKKILAKRSSKTKEFNKDLKNLTDFIELLYDEIPVLYKKFKQDR